MREGMIHWDDYSIGKGVMTTLVGIIVAFSESLHHMIHLVIPISMEPWANRIKILAQLITIGAGAATMISVYFKYEVRFKRIRDRIRSLFVSNKIKKWWDKKSGYDKLFYRMLALVLFLLIASFYLMFVTK